MRDSFVVCLHSKFEIAKNLKKKEIKINKYKIKMLLELTSEYSEEQQSKIDKLRSLVQDNDELEIGTEACLLTKFLNFAGWDVERANESIKRYYDFKHRHPDWVASHPVSYFREHYYRTLSKFIMPKPDKCGRAVIVFKTVDAFNKFPNYIHDIVEMDDLLLESMMLLPQVQKYGFTVIYDITGTTMNFLRNMGPSFARLINEKNEILPVTSRVVHIIQKGFLMHAATSLIMPFMSKEFKERMVFHDGKNYDRMRELIGVDSLPAPYGGLPENILDVDLTYNHLLKHSDYLLKLQSYKMRAQ